MTTVTTIPATTHDPLTPPILRVIHAIIDAAGARQPFEHAAHFSLTIFNEPFEALVVESWPTPDPIHGERRRVSIAHYYRQHGDLIADPELELTDAGHPIAFQTPPVQVLGLGASAGSLPISWRRAGDGAVLIDTRAKREVDAFCRLWASNLKQQGFIRAAKRQANRQ